MGSWDWDLVQRDCMWDEGQYRIFGVDPKSFKVTLENVGALIDPEDWLRLQRMLQGFSGDREAHQTEFRIRRPNGEVRWCMGTAAARVDGAGRMVRVSGVTVDITERKRNEERQALLAREVDHRAKNALAVVQSIVRLTRSDTIESYVGAVEGRIGALARAHTLLAQSRWQGADLAALIDEELAPYRTDNADRVDSAGPPVSLEPRTAQTIALAVHELATNAAKHGALSSLSGRVAITWELKPGSLVLNWTEIGGPNVQSPAVRGFGIKVINSSIEAQLGGKAHFDWRRDGMHCTLTIPHGGEIEQTPSVSRVHWLAEDGEFPPRLPRGKQVMIVEDEALIGMMMKDTLTELGLTVNGPFSTLSGALRAAHGDDVDFAILDVNLAGEWVYPVADVLVARGIPFIFVTGYGADSVDCRFAQAQVFEKPIEPRSSKPYSPPESSRRSTPAAATPGHRLRAGRPSCVDRLEMQAARDRMPRTGRYACAAALLVAFNGVAVAQPRPANPIKPLRQIQRGRIELLQFIRQKRSCCLSPILGNGQEDVHAKACSLLVRRADAARPWELRRPGAVRGAARTLRLAGHASHPRNGEFDRVFGGQPLLLRRSQGGCHRQGARDHRPLAGRHGTKTLLLGAAGVLLLPSARLYALNQ